MKKYFLYLLLSLLLSFYCFGQSFTSFYLGNTVDLATQPLGGICLMGGASENDSAMVWFLRQANGGDVLVLRASGGDGYNHYLYSQLGVGINAVETIVFHDSTASYDPYIHQKILQAEAIWIAGGDQWDYISFWRNSPVDSLINHAIATRNIVIGGTSAGMAILGGFYFSAQNGTVTSSDALLNPYNANMTVDSTSFLKNSHLKEVITDTHYDNPNRKGRHVAFLARILVDYGVTAKGIACDEYTAVCIDSNGMAVVFGDYPNYDDNAYFIQPNCELLNVAPEQCAAGDPLHWNLGNAAIKVYKVKGTASGNHSFDLNTWQTGMGGTWENWFVDNGVLNESPSIAPNCSQLTLQYQVENTLAIYPNPCQGVITIDGTITGEKAEVIKIVNAQGQVIKLVKPLHYNKIVLDIRELPEGVYWIEIAIKERNPIIRKLIKSH